MDVLVKFHPKGVYSCCQLSSEETLPKCTVNSCLNHFHFEDSKLLLWGNPQVKLSTSYPTCQKLMARFPLNLLGIFMDPGGRMLGEPSHLSCRGGYFQLCKRRNLLWIWQKFTGRIYTLDTSCASILHNSHLMPRTFEFMTAQPLSGDCLFFNPTDRNSKYILVLCILLNSYTGDSSWGFYFIFIFLCSFSLLFIWWP